MFSKIFFSIIVTLLRKNFQTLYNFTLFVNTFFRLTYKTQKYISIEPFMNVGTKKHRIHQRE